MSSVTLTSRITPVSLIISFAVIVLAILVIVPQTLFAGGNLGFFETNQAPNSLRQSQGALFELGYIDVTKAPYNADNNGNQDASNAIQQAVNDGYAYNLVVWFPKGTYKVSQRIKLYQSNGGYNGLAQRRGQRKFAHILQGDSTGGTSPTIRLADNTPTSRGRIEYSGSLNDIVPVFDIAYVENGQELYDRNYTSALRNLRIDMGNNPGWTAVKALGAQDISIEDIDVVGQNFRIGFAGMPHAGGSIMNVSVTGGRIGIYQNHFDPDPVATGVRLVGQSEAGVYFGSSWGPINLVGLEYKGSAPAILLTGGANTHEALHVIDSRLEVTGNGPAIAVSGNGVRNVYLRNVYVKANGVTAGNIGGLDTKGTNWTHVGEFMYKRGAAGILAINNQTILNKGAQGSREFDVTAVNSAPNDLRTRHTWNTATFPNHWQNGMLDIRDFGATADNDSNDDAVAINQALQQSVQTGKTVFIPRGHWHIKRTVEVPAGAQMIGAAKNTAIIQAHHSWRPSSHTAAVRTANSNQQGVILSAFGIHTEEPNAQGRFGRNTEAHKYIASLHHQTTNSIIRSIQHTTTESWKNNNSWDQPLLLFTGNAGGRVFNSALDMGYKGPTTNRFAIIAIENTDNPLAFYAPNPEQMQLGPQIRILNSDNVTMYGLKYETWENNHEMSVINSNNISIFGGAGISALAGGKALHQVQNSSNYAFINVSCWWCDNSTQMDVFDDGTISVPASNDKTAGFIRNGNIVPYGEMVSGEDAPIGGGGTAGGGSRQCHKYSGPVPGFGAPVSFFGGGLLISGTCTDSNIDVTVGNGVNGTWVFDDGYLWENNVWKRVSLSGSNKSGVWFPGTASANIPAQSGATYFVGYTCELVGSAWKCGCGNHSCSQKLWQIQGFE